jgi:hypothetical protein
MRHTLIFLLFFVFIIIIIIIIIRNLRYKEGERERYVKLQKHIIIDRSIRMSKRPILQIDPPLTDDYANTRSKAGGDYDPSIMDQSPAACI